MEFNVLSSVWVRLIERRSGFCAQWWLCVNRRGPVCHILRVLIWPACMLTHHAKTNTHTHTQAPYNWLSQLFLPSALLSSPETWSCFLLYTITLQSCSRGQGNVPSRVASFFFFWPRSQGEEVPLSVQNNVLWLRESWVHWIRKKGFSQRRQHREAFNISWEAKKKRQASCENIALTRILPSIDEVQNMRNLCGITLKNV